MVEDKTVEMEMEMEMGMEIGKVARLHAAGSRDEREKTRAARRLCARGGSTRDRPRQVTCGTRHSPCDGETVAQCRVCVAIYRLYQPSSLRRTASDAGAAGAGPVPRTTVTCPACAD